MRGRDQRNRLNGSSAPLACRDGDAIQSTNLAPERAALGAVPAGKADENGAGIRPGMRDDRFERRVRSARDWLTEKLHVAGRQFRGYECCRNVLCGHRPAGAAHNDLRGKIRRERAFKLISHGMTEFGGGKYAEASRLRCGPEINRAKHGAKLRGRARCQQIAQAYAADVDGCLAEKL